ncbi:hypothetical protein VSH64_25910 [Amycolatopsis rhabdoformis]|uniref:Uncharacterized protein n=1 Tax=Amycolatopsis rhabdoformis TaxID=1448059 RepID=A0ABZ1HY43_9PSEU|nr:hypothetical protein [Amycolatopsis rhabdoformis]WSE26314.1 hypothetical protein VSH64_25910 [Amycolatopsis rhabdoformis]
MELRDGTGRVLARLAVDESANGERLKITSALTGEHAFADALMLEALTWVPDEVLAEPDPGTKEQEQ